MGITGRQAVFAVFHHLRQPVTRLERWRGREGQTRRHRMHGKRDGGAMSIRPFGAMLICPFLFSAMCGQP